jgi:transposase-like protein
MLIRQGMPLRRVAELFHTSYESIRRLAKSQAIGLQQSGRKLTPEQLAQAYALLRSDTPFREVAQQFGINPESLRRLAQRDRVPVRARGEKLTPTQRKLTAEQQEEASALVRSGNSLRQTARLLGISRSALEGILKEGTGERA